jgi:hypothetical protein
MRPLCAQSICTVAVGVKSALDTKGGGACGLCRWILLAALHAGKASACVASASWHKVATCLLDSTVALSSADCCVHMCLQLCLSCRQCSSGLQAIADVAAAIRAGFYSVGLAAGG